MDTILGFFSDLILFTAGLFVISFWALIIMVVSVEVFDLITGNDSKLFPDPEDEDR